MIVVAPQLFHVSKVQQVQEIEPEPEAEPLTDKEKERIDRLHPDSYDEAIKYGINFFYMYKKEGLIQSSLDKSNIFGLSYISKIWQSDVIEL